MRFLKSVIPTLFSLPVQLDKPAMVRTAKRSAFVNLNENVGKK